MPDPTSIRQLLGLMAEEEFAALAETELPHAQELAGCPQGSLWRNPTSAILVPQRSNLGIYHVRQGDFGCVGYPNDARSERHWQRGWPAAIGMMRTVMDWNVRGARALDRVVFPESWRKNADYDFERRVVPELLRAGMLVWDVGCGSRPLVKRATKKDLRLRVIGLDIDSSELALMGPGLCDGTVVTDLCMFRGDGSADLVICRTVLEHVPDVDRAFAGLASIVRAGGMIAICVPCRNALFARLNLLLPESAKRWLLYWIWPHKADGHNGFPARYDRCTPKDFATLAKAHGLRLRELRTYWRTSYFMFLLPLWALWRAWQLAARATIGDQAAEGFVLIAERSDSVETTGFADRSSGATGTKGTRCPAQRRPTTAPSGSGERIASRWNTV